MTLRFWIRTRQGIRHDFTLHKRVGRQPRRIRDSSRKQKFLLRTSHLGLRTWGKSAFVEIDKFEHCLNGPRRQADFGQALIQTLCPFIAPTALGHECIPHFHFVVARFAAMRKCPLQQFLVAAAFERFGFESCVIDFEKLATTGVKIRIRSRSSRGSPAFGQFSLLKQPDFVQHTTEVNNPFDLSARASQPWNESWI